jgi:hypothetical protein
MFKEPGMSALKGNPGNLREAFINLGFKTRVKGSTQKSLFSTGFFFPVKYNHFFIKLL